MLPPASPGSPRCRKQDMNQFTILTDWGNLSVCENFADRNEGIERLRDMQLLRIIQAVLASPQRKQGMYLHDVAQDQASFARRERRISLYKQRFTEVRQVCRAEQKIDPSQESLTRECRGCRQSHQAVR